MGENIKVGVYVDCENMVRNGGKGFRYDDEVIRRKQGKKTA